MLNRLYGIHEGDDEEQLEDSEDDDSMYEEADDYYEGDYFDPYDEEGLHPSDGEYLPDDPPPLESDSGSDD